ncbi:exosortase U [Botrimarina colliarenosi]|uniref:exosortase U n=1 Tax=Botrimarina colliarenosi TaxID=2528001 RepID=UPI0018D40C2B|nr:exosortase U [Botrimarina colliarenosi]
MAALAIALIAAYGPILVEFFHNVWRRPHYQHFPFVLAASALLFMRDLSTRPGRAPGPLWAAGGAVAAWALLALAYQIPSPLFAAASLLLLAGAAGCVIARSIGARFPWGAWALSWLVLPPPVGLDYRLIEVLQRSSSWLASQALDVLQINHLMEGNALVLADKTLFVDEACSGIVSAVSIISCAAMYAVWRRRGVAHTLLLMAMSAGWAMLLNVVRIVSIALAHRQFNLDLAEGVPHTLVGLGAFALSLVTLVASDWLLKALLAEVGPRWSQMTGESIRWGGGLVDAWDRLVATPDAAPATPTLSAPRERVVFRWDRVLTSSLGVGAALTASLAFAGLGATQLVRPAGVQTAELDFPNEDQFAETLEAEGLPAELFGLQLIEKSHRQRDDDSAFGQHSVIYSYQDKKGQVFLVSCDFPFVGGWHDLSVCYRGIGWEMNERLIDQAGSAEGTPFDYAQMAMTKPDGRSALVTFCACQRDGTAIDAPAMTFKEGLLRAFSRRQAFADSRQCFQVQVLTERAEALSEADRSLSLEMLEEARRRFTAVALEL